MPPRRFAAPGAGRPDFALGGPPPRRDTDGPDLFAAGDPLQGGARPAQSAHGLAGLRPRRRAHGTTIVRVELDGKDLLVLTRSGAVQRMDAETGRVHWRATVGKPYTMLPFLGANERSVYVIANAKIVALDRATGTAEVGVRPAGGDQRRGRRWTRSKSTSPTRTTSLRAFLLPFVTEETAGFARARSAAARRSTGARSTTSNPRPRPTWSDLTNIQLTFKPLLSSDVVFVISPSGKALGYDKIPQARGTIDRTNATASAPTAGLACPPGSFGDTAYVGSDDAACSTPST